MLHYNGTEDFTGALRETAESTFRLDGTVFAHYTCTILKNDQPTQHQATLGESVAIAK